MGLLGRVPRSGRVHLYVLNLALVGLQTSNLPGSLHVVQICENLVSFDLGQDFSALKPFVSTRVFSDAALHRGVLFQRGLSFAVADHWN